MPFGRNARIQLEHGGLNESTEHYRTVTYWYGSPGASLVPTDTLQIGDADSERAHRYHSPQASDPYTITSRYEWGTDTIRLPGREDGPRANPDDFAEYEFAAVAGQPYTIWVRGKNLDGKNTSDAFWMQFDDEIGTTRLAASYAHPKGFGNWLDRFPAGRYAWSSALPQDPPQTVTFNRGGQHRLRIQPRHPHHRLEQIWLSTTQKTLPEPSQRAPKPGEGPGEVVLDAADAVRVRGRIKPVDDAQAAAGRALEIDGNATSTDPASAVAVFPPHSDRGRKTTGVSEFTSEARSQERRCDAQAQARLRVPQPARGNPYRRREPARHRSWRIRLEAGRRLVPRRVEYLRLLQPERGARRHRAQGANLQPPFPRRRVPGAARSDRRPFRDPRPRSLHTGGKAPFPGAPYRNWPGAKSSTQRTAGSCRSE